MTSSVALRVALAAGGVAALFVVVNLFSMGFRVFCLLVIAAAAVAVAPVRAQRGGGWWWLLAGGAALSITGRSSRSRWRRREGGWRSSVACW